MTLGVALCGMAEEFPTGPAIVEKMKTTKFIGVSGPAKLDNVTGTRSEAGLNFKVVNLIIDTSEESILFKARTSSLINLPSEEITVVTPFVYSQGAEVPPQLPTADINLNLLSDGVRALGWTAAAITMLSSLGFAIWTWKHRRKNLIRVAQPAFLCLLCAGTASWPQRLSLLSLQEPVSDHGMDIACMCVPWLFTMGFSAAIAAMLFKVRLNKVSMLEM